MKICGSRIGRICRPFGGRGEKCGDHDETIVHLYCDETEFLRVDTESFLKDTDSVKEVLLKLDENGLTVSHDDKEIDKTEITLTTAAAVSMAEGKLKLEEVKD